MKYYSEVTKKFYETEDECIAAEAEKTSKDAAESAEKERLKSELEQVEIALEDAINHHDNLYETCGAMEDELYKKIRDMQEELAAKVDGMLKESSNEVSELTAKRDALKKEYFAKCGVASITDYKDVVSEIAKLFNIKLF